MIDHTRIDLMALAGYLWARGDGSIEHLRFVDQLDIDAFNAGIANYNIATGSHVPPLFVVTTRHRDGANGNTADKELAIVGASK